MSERATKATVCPQDGGGNYSSSEQLLKQREGADGERGDGGRWGKKERWPGEKPKRREIRSNGNEFSETQRFESK